MKSSIIGKSGNLIASKPDNESNMQQQLLESGLISAILTFSKQLHKQEIQSLTYHDRITSFIEFKEFFLIIEISTAIDIELRNQILKIIQEKSIELLENRSEKDLSLGEGDLILEEIIYQSQNEVQSELKKPLEHAEKGEFDIVHNEDSSYEITNQINSLEYADKLAVMINNGLIACDYQLAEEIISAFIPDLKEKMIYHAIIKHENRTTNVGIIKLPIEENSTLFRLAPYIDRQIKEMLKNKANITIQEIISNLVDIYNTRREVKSFDSEYFSISYLDKNVKGLEKVIYPIVIGDPAIIVGDKLSTRIVTTSLSIFAQHLNTEVIEWLTGEIKIGSNITGVSREVYDELVKEGGIDESVTVVNLIDNKIKGKNASSYFKKVFDNVKKKSPEEAYKDIGKELEKLAFEAMQVTSLAILDRKDAAKKLQQIYTGINNKSKFNKIMTLASKRNPLIEYLLEDLKSTVHAAEDYLGIF